jgi:hypothetical protein
MRKRETTRARLRANTTRLYEIATRKDDAIAAALRAMLTDPTVLSGATTLEAVRALTAGYTPGVEFDQAGYEGAARELREIGASYARMGHAITAEAFDAAADAYDAAHQARQVVLGGDDA